MDFPIRRPMAWGYARVSDNKQIEQEDSITFQMQRIESYYRFKLAESGVDFGSIEMDPHGVSASKRPFHLRKAGARLMNMMQAGDHLIIDKIDRIWRSLPDLVHMLQWFEDHKIVVHFVNLQGMSADTHSFMGGFMIKLFVILAELEAKQLSERVFSHNAAARKMGRAISPKGPPGTRTFKKKSHDRKIRSYVEWDPSRRAIMAEIVRLREEDKMSWTAIAIKLEKHLAQVNGRPFSKSAFYKKYWNYHKVIEHYAAEKWYRDYKIDSVCDIPINIRALAMSKYVKS